MSKRICAFRGCKTILNKYNSDPCCSIHQEKYLDIMDARIQDYSHEINTLRAYIRQSNNIERLERRIEVLLKRVKHAKRLRDRQYSCVKVAPIDPEKTIYSQRADVPVGF